MFLRLEFLIFIINSQDEKFTIIFYPLCSTNFLKIWWPNSRHRESDMNQANCSSYAASMYEASRYEI